MKSLRHFLLGCAVLLSSLYASAATSPSNQAWTDSYLLENAGKYAQAGEAIEPILRANPYHQFALMRRGWLSYLQGNMNDALTYYNRAISLNPKALDARLGLTLPLLAQQRWTEAAVELQKVIDVSPQDYTANLRMLICLEGLQRWEDMSKLANNMAARYPSDTSMAVYLARAEIWRGNNKAAKNAYLKVLERDPNHAEASRYVQANP